MTDDIWNIETCFFHSKVWLYFWKIIVTVVLSRPFFVSFVEHEAAGKMNAGKVLLKGPVSPQACQVRVTRERVMINY